MNKLILTVAAAALALGTITPQKADARGFGRGVALGLIGASVVMHAARAERARQERAAAAMYARRAAAAARARAVAQARAEGRARAMAAAKAKAAAQAQARVASAQKAEIARLKAQNEQLQQGASTNEKVAATPASQQLQTAQSAPPVAKPIEVKQVITGECKRFLPAAGITVSAPCS